MLTIKETVRTSEQAENDLGLLGADIDADRACLWR
jgi:hypothetical protein